jgi:hypothetical protein
VSLNPSAAGAYYNLGLAYAQKEDQSTACDYAYHAGRAYLKKRNVQQALRMVVFMKSIDPKSRLIDKLHKEIVAQAK